MTRSRASELRLLDETVELAVEMSRRECWDRQPLTTGNKGRFRLSREWHPLFARRGTYARLPISGKWKGNDERHKRRTSPLGLD